MFCFLQELQKHHTCLPTIIWALSDGINQIHDACAIFAILEPTGDNPVNGVLTASSWGLVLMQQKNAPFLVQVFDLYGRKMHFGGNREIDVSLRYSATYTAHIIQKNKTTVLKLVLD